MLKKIEGRYWWNSQMEQFIEEADKMVEKYDWKERTVSPYGWAMKVTRVIDELRDFTNCTEGSREYLVALANGLADIMNKWEEHEQEPKVRVRVVGSGKEFDMCADMVESFVEEGLVEVV